MSPQDNYPQGADCRICRKSFLLEQLDDGRCEACLLVGMVCSCGHQQELDRFPVVGALSIDKELGVGGHAVIYSDVYACPACGTLRVMTKGEAK